jgi:hypothetical protein
MDYLLRLTEPDEYGATLQLFTDEEEFAGYLKDITEAAHDSGMGPLIAGIWSWDEKDRREELEMVTAGESREDGWLDQRYQVRHKFVASPPLFSFTASFREDRT